MTGGRGAAGGGTKGLEGGAGGVCGNIGGTNGRGSGCFGGAGGCEGAVPIGGRGGVGTFAGGSPEELDFESWLTRVSIDVLFC